MFWRSLAVVGLLSSATTVVVAQDRDCEQLLDFYPGYEECAGRMSWLQSNWDQESYRDDYINSGIDGTWCSVQKFLSLEKKADSTPHYYCPDPDDEIVDDFIDHGNGVTSMLVYRALSYADDNPWSRRLLEANAGNLAGVFQYIHAEVVPETQREQEQITNFQRKFNINSVMIYNVTYKNPESVRQKMGPGNHYLGEFAAMDKGQCTATAICARYKEEGFFVGWQAGDTVRSKYAGSKWFSFPQCGYCTYPTGEKGCTYTYEVVGRLDLDIMVGLVVDNGKLKARMYDNKEIDIPAVSGQSAFKTFVEAGNLEFDRSKENCPLVTEGGLQYWKDPCDQFKCKVRMQKAVFAATPFLDTSMAGQGDGPPDATVCLAPTMPPTTLPPTPMPTGAADGPTPAGGGGGGGGGRQPTPAHQPAEDCNMVAAQKCIGDALGDACGVLQERIKCIDDHHCMTPLEDACASYLDTAKSIEGCTLSCDGASGTTTEHSKTGVLIALVIVMMVIVGAMLLLRRRMKREAFLLNDMDELFDAEYQPPAVSADNGVN